MVPFKVVTVIQARCGSTRLPDKVLLPLSGKSLLVRMVERVQASKFAGTVVVATTTSPQDDAIENLCREAGFECFRGHETDLLDRHYQCGLQYQADAVVKIPSDCPLIDPGIIDQVLEYYLSNLEKYDFVSNLHPPTWPDGNDVEIMAMKALKVAHVEAETTIQREHTTPFFWQNPHRFKIGNVSWTSGLDFSRTHRWTIDYPEDYQLIAAVYRALYPKNHLFGLCDILTLLEEHPTMGQLNQMYLGEGWYSTYLQQQTHNRQLSQLNKGTED